MTFLSFILVASSILLFKSTISHRSTATILALLVFLSLFLLGTYLIIDELSGDGINEALIYHLTMDLDGAAVSDFSKIILYSILYIILIIFIAIIAYKLSLGFKKKSFLIPRRIGAITLLLGSLAIDPGVVQSIQLFNSFNSNINTISLESPPHYIAQLETLNSEPKNLVYIYLESLERTYLDESLFPELTPNLTNLEKEAISFSNIRQVYGSEWTIAGMVSSQCGIPLITPSDGNALGNTDLFLPEATCIGDILRHNNYNLNFIQGADLKFAGKGLFYNSHGFQKVEGLHELISQHPAPDNTSGWGIYDDITLNTIKERFDQLAQSNEPFAIFALTVDTHHPNGNESNFCKNIKYKDGKNPMLNAVHCADTMIANLINHIKASNIYHDTVVVISSDHLAMPNTATSQLKKGDRNNTFMILSKDLKPREISSQGALIDIAPTILDVMGFHNKALGFGRSLLQNTPTLSMSLENINLFLSKQRSFINQLWTFPSIKNGMTITKNTLKIKDRNLEIPALIILNNNLDTDYFLFSEGSNLLQKISTLTPNNNFIYIDRCQNILLLSPQTAINNTNSSCIAIGQLSQKKLRIHELNNNSTSSLSYSSLLPYAQENNNSSLDLYHKRISAIDNYNKYGIIDNKHNISSLTLQDSKIDAQSNFTLYSAGGYLRSSHFNSYNKETQPTLLSRGLTVIGVDAKNNISVLRHIDTCQNEPQLLPYPQYRFKDEIDNMNEKYEVLMIASHDSAICDSKNNLETLFIDSGLQEWRQIDFRTPYIAIINKNGIIREFTGETNQSILINFH